jgi:hypothetical protein
MWVAIQIEIGSNTSTYAYAWPEFKCTTMCRVALPKHMCTHVLTTIRSQSNHNQKAPSSSDCNLGAPWW